MSPVAVSASTPVEAHLRAAEQRLVEAFALRPLSLPATLTDSTGQWKDEPVAVVTRAYAGDAVAYACVAIASGAQIMLGSILVVPRANRPVPIFNAIVSWSCARGETTVSVDLVPVRDALEREAEVQEIVRLLPDLSRLPRVGNRTEWHSPSSWLQTRVAAGQEPDVLRALDGYMEAFITLLAGTPPNAEMAYQIRRVHHGFLLAQRQDEGLAILKTIFGKRWADEYVTRVLFPST